MFPESWALSFSDRGDHFGAHLGMIQARTPNLDAAGCHARTTFQLPVARSRGRRQIVTVHEFNSNCIAALMDRQESGRGL